MSNVDPIRIIVLTCLVFLARPTLAIDLYVSPTGDDNAAGTEDQPLRTLTAARDRLRQVAPHDRTVTVWLDDGRYELAETFELLTEDTGTPEAPVRYRAIEGSQPVISGGRLLPTDRWERMTERSLNERLDSRARGRVWRIDLAGLGIEDYGTLKGRGFAAPVLPMEMELIADGKRMTLARWPNLNDNKAKRFGKVEYGEVIDAGAIPRLGDFSDKPGRFVFDNPRIEAWAEADDAWLHGKWNYDWADKRVRLLGVDLDERVLTASPSHYGFGAGRSHISQGGHFYAVNIFEELDAPGEYYIDRQRGVLYYYPDGKLPEQTLVVTMVEGPLVAIENASYITLQGLTLAESRSVGVSIVGGSHNRIVGCTLRNLGCAAVNIGEGEDGRKVIGVSYGGGSPGNPHGLYGDTAWNRNSGFNNGVIRCHIYDIAGYGVLLGGGDRKTLTPGHNFVVDSHIHHTARVYEQMFPNISIDGVGNRVAHNRLSHNPHSVIMYWGNDHLIEYNRIHDAVYDSSDAGAIYTGRDPGARGNVIRYNFFHDISGHHDYEGIFFDDGASGQWVVGNVFLGIQSNGAVKYHGGQLNRFINNLVIDCKQPIRYQLWNQKKWTDGLKEGGLAAQRLQAINWNQPPHSERYPELAKIYELPYSLEREIEERNYVTTRNDPAFADPENLDFTILNLRAVRREVPGFEPIIFDRIGIRPVDGMPGE